MRRPARRSAVRLLGAVAAVLALVLGATACADDGDAEDGSSESEAQDEPDEGGVVEESDVDPDEVDTDGSFNVETEGAESDDTDDLNDVEVNDDLGPDFPVEEIPVIDGENSELVEAGGWLVTVDVEGDDLDAIYGAAASLLADAGFEIGPDSTNNSGFWSSADWSVELVTYPSEEDGYATVQYGVTPN